MAAIVFEGIDTSVPGYHYIRIGRRRKRKAISHPFRRRKGKEDIPAYGPSPEFLRAYQYTIQLAEGIVKDRLSISTARPSQRLSISSSHRRILRNSLNQPREIVDKFTFRRSKQPGGIWPSRKSGAAMRYSCETSWSTRRERPISECLFYLD